MSDNITTSLEPCTPGSGKVGCDTVRVEWCGKMVEATRVAGNIIKLAAKVSFCTLQGTFTKGLG